MQQLVQKPKLVLPLLVIILQQLLLFFAKNIATLTAKLETAGNENKDAIDGLKDKLEAPGVDNKAALTAIATNIKSLCYKS